MGVAWIVLYASGGLVALLLAVGAAMWVLGGRIPPEHTAAASVRLNRPAGEVWSTISDIRGHTRWAGVTRLERLPDRDGRETWRQFMGRNSFVLVTTEIAAPSRLVRTIDDDAGFFSGSWTYGLRPEGAATVVTLTENGRVGARVPRFVMRHLMGCDTYLRKHLRALAGALGEPGAAVTRV